MKPTYKGQRTQSATDRKFHPTDEHVIEKNKEELDNMTYADNREPVSAQDRYKFAAIDKKAKASK